MKEFFPEIAAQQKLVESVIKEEELAFAKTWDRGVEHFAKAQARAKNNIITGEDAFTLYDTYGFPVDLTRLMAEERGLKVDMGEYDKMMEQAKERSRQAQQSGTGVSIQLDAEATDHLNKQKIPPTDDLPKFFIQDIDAHILAIWNGKKFVDQADADANIPFGIIVDRTNFYAEAGGQTYDVGTFSKNQVGFAVESVQSYAGYCLHVAN